MQNKKGNVNELNDFRFEVSLYLNELLIEMLLVKQMKKDFKHTKKEFTMIRNYYDDLRICFDNEFHRLNKDKLKDLDKMLNK